MMAQENVAGFPKLISRNLNPGAVVKESQGRTRETEEETEETNTNTSSNSS